MRRVDVTGGHVLHHRGRAAALRVHQELGAGVTGAQILDVLRGDAGVHVAFAVPHVHRPAQRALHVGAQPHVGPEQDLGVLAVLAPDVLDDLHRVGGGAAVVGLALTSAEVLTYMTTIAPGCSAFHARSWAAVIESASEQPASRSGSTVLSGHRTEAVSAMKCTPQNAITSASVAAAWRESPSESPTKSATSWTSGTW